MQHAYAFNRRSRTIVEENAEQWLCEDEVRLGLDLITMEWKSWVLAGLLVSFSLLPQPPSSAAPGYVLKRGLDSDLDSL